MIDGLKLKLYAQEIEAGIEREIERLTIIVKNGSSGGTIQLPTDSQLVREARAARLDIARLSFIRDHLVENEAYWLGWGDISAMGPAFYSKPAETRTTVKALEEKTSDDGSPSL